MNWFQFSAIVALLVFCVFKIETLLEEVFDICFDTDRILFGIVAIYLITTGIWGICAIIF